MPAVGGDKLRGVTGGGGGGVDCWLALGECGGALAMEPAAAAVAAAAAEVKEIETMMIFLERVNKKSTLDPGTILQNMMFLSECIVHRHDLHEAKRDPTSFNASSSLDRALALLSAMLTTLARRDAEPKDPRNSSLG